MSMSEFERQDQRSEQELSFCCLLKYHYPGDFNEEDRAFAEKLNALFLPEQEELPPYYVPTLLNWDDQCLESIERGFEHKTSARVFRRLKLRRRLFKPDAFSFKVLHARVSNVPMRRSILGLVTTLLFVMLFTVAFTGPAFATGVALLLHGGSGVYLGPHPPPLGMMWSSLDGGQNTLGSGEELPIQMQSIQQQVPFPIYLAQNPLNYSLNRINLYVGVNQQWTDGPTLELEYNLSQPATTQGMGEVWIREFKPKVDVLQYVEDGAASPVQVDASGRALAIYVNGQWVMHDRNMPGPVWMYGQRSELIYQLNGVIFWIVSDPRDGIGEPQLMQIAQGLTPYTLSREFRMMESSISLWQLNEDVFGPFSNDVIVVFPEDGDTGPYYMSVSSHKPSKSVQ